MSSTRWSGTNSRRARATLTPMVLAGSTCWRCGHEIKAWQEIDPQTGRKKWAGQPWHAGHLEAREEGGTHDPANLAPEHAHCSTSDGGKRGIAHMQAANRARRDRPRPTQGREATPFEGTEQPTHAFSTSFPPGSVLVVPERLPDVVAAATILTAWPEGTDIGEAHEGARWLGLPLFPQGVEVASVMQACRVDGRPLNRWVVVEIARRSTKTTAALATLLGRCLARPGYKVASTAQTGMKARRKLLEVMDAILVAGFERDGHGHCLRGMGDTRIKFANGSEWVCLPPKAEAFRQEAFDAVLVDEAGELDPETADDLMAGITPTLDTRPQAQVVVAGTPGKVRAGLLWKMLERLRAGRPRVGGVVYEAPERAEFVDPETGEVDWSLLLRVHPGISCGLTDVETVVGNIEDMGLARWQREYLCLWPVSSSVTALDVAGWRACEVEGRPVRPENAGVGWSVDKDGSTAALVAAWRDGSGRACLDVLAVGAGFDWVPAEARRVQEELRAPAAYDAIGPCIEAADVMSRAPFRVRTTVVPFREQVGGQARLDKEISRRNVQQFGDPALTAAVEASAWRPAGGARLFLSRPGSSVLCAAATALWSYDQRHRAGSGGRRVRSSVGLERKLRERGVR